MKGHYYDRRYPHVMYTQEKVMLDVNIGIAMITPSYLLHEILFSEKAKRQRGG
jgi:hypothetical protein